MARPLWKKGVAIPEGRAEGIAEEQADVILGCVFRCD